MVPPYDWIVRFTVHNIAWKVDLADRHGLLIEIKLVYHIQAQPL